jgi:hypothetical protein
VRQGRPSCEVLAQSPVKLADDKRAEWNKAYDASVIIVKQRDGGEETTIKLWFHRESNSYSDRRLDHRPPLFEVPKVKPKGLLAVETKALNEEEFYEVHAS